MKLGIKQVIDNWDPIGLFPYAPSNEYIKEIEIIEQIISKDPNISIQDLALGIQSTFSSRFGSDVFTCDIRDCERIAKKIKINIIP